MLYAHTSKHCNSEAGVLPDSPVMLSVCARRVASERATGGAKQHLMLLQGCNPACRGP